MMTTAPLSTSGSPTQADPRLAVAVNTAIWQSLVAAADLETRVKQALGALNPLWESIGESADTEATVKLLRDALRTAHAEAAGLFDRQKNTLETVNISLFGRTGAGKSSLIEALSHGAGLSISDSRSDFTTEVRPTNWHGVQFFDTPGICGWGRSMARSELEARARQAAEVADIVVLCFDNYGQLQAEFTKIAAWVKEFGKAVIVVLNVKNSHWRWPEKLEFGSRRRQVAQAVRENSSNIRTELSAIGIYGAPIIAISAQRAVYARASEDYAGPDFNQYVALRKILDQDELLKQSNLEVFEEIVIEALSRHAVDIRLGMLHAQVRALLERLSGELNDALKAAQTGASLLDSAIKSILEIVGYPPQDSSRRAALPITASGDDVLTAAENARGEKYKMPSVGRVARETKQRCNSHFGEVRSESIKAANCAISECFERRCPMDEETFAQRVYDPQRIKETAAGVLTECAEYLKRELKLTLADSRLDLEYVGHEGSKIGGDVGNGMRVGGIVARVAGVIGIAATGLALLPEPVITKGAAFVLGIVAGVTGFIGEHLTGKARLARENARAEAFADATCAVNHTYDKIAEQIESTMETLLTTSGQEALVLPLQNATALWTFAGEVSQSSELLTLVIATLPTATKAQYLLENAALTVASLRGGNSVNLDHTLLGEDWITDPSGLTADIGSAEPKRTPAYDPSIFDRIFTGLRKFSMQFGNETKRDAATQWLVETESVLASEERATTALSELREMLTADKARYHLLGDYSTGKTSFIKRLLIDAGLPLPPTIKVKADPTTDTIHDYEWENALLVDSPGLQSSKSSHTEIALMSVSDASVLICMFQPNLLVGSTSTLEQILKGDATKGLAAKLKRTIFVIHRADEFGPDPDLVPERFVHVCDLKKLELQQALASKGILVEIERIVCMASDPRGMVGDRRDVNSTEFDRFRSWDGFKQFHVAIRTIHKQTGASGPDFSVLEGGLARLGRIESQMQVEIDDLKKQIDVFSTQIRIFDEITSAGTSLEGDLQEQARKLVQDYAQGLRSREARNDEELRNKAAVLAKWWEQPDFAERANHWQADAQCQIEAWWTESSERLNRTMSSPRFQAAIAGASDILDPSVYRSGKPNIVKRGLNFLLTPLKGATRDTIYSIGKTLGYKFKPWEAVKLTKSLSRASVVLGAFLAAWDGFRLLKFFKAEKRAQEQEKKLDDFISKTTEQVFNSITLSGDESQGPLEALGIIRQELQSIGHELSGTCERIKESRAKLIERLSRVRDRMNNAWLALGEAFSKL